MVLSSIPIIFAFSFFKENIKQCPKGIDLGTIFRYIYGKMIKHLILLITFYISHKSDVKTFLIWIINNYLKVTR